MARAIMDDGLRSWDVFASTGPFGYGPGSVLVFSCTTDPGERPRTWTISGDQSDAEMLVAQAPAPELLALLGRAEPLR